MEYYLPYSGEIWEIENTAPNIDVYVHDAPEHTVYTLYDHNGNVIEYTDKKQVFGFDLSGKSTL